MKANYLNQYNCSLPGKITMIDFDMSQYIFECIDVANFKVGDSVAGIGG